jgi:hypothetical protein
MSLAIKFGDITNPSSISGAIYFDAVTEYKRQYSGRVTEHPIEAGASVSDHFISANPKISIDGVISSVDFSYIPSLLSLDGTGVVNNNGQPDAISVGGMGGLRQFLPNVISQFLPTLSPTVNVDTSGRNDHRAAVETLMKDLINGLYLNQDRQKWENRMTPTTLYEVYGISVNPFMEDLIVTKFSIEESVENGDGLWFSMEMEQVRFVTLESAEAPSPAQGSKTQRQTTPQKDKGNAPSTTTSATTPSKPRDVLGNFGSAIGGR